jgi:hypothetical protein
MLRSRARSLLLLCPILLPACGGADRAEETPVLAWHLPRNSIEATAQYEFLGCSLEGNRLRLTLASTVTLASRSARDDSARVEIPTSDLRSFWSTNTVAVKTNDDGVLQTIAAKPSDQTPAIIGNVIQTAVKVLPLALGVPVAARAQRAECGEAVAVRRQIDALRESLRNPRVETKEVERLTAAIARLRGLVTVTEKATYAPGDTPAFAPPQPDQPLSAGNPLVVLLLTPGRQGVERARWLSPAGLASAFTAEGAAGPDLLAHRVEVQLRTGRPEALAPTPLPAGAHYRDPRRLDFHVVQYRVVNDEAAADAPEVHGFRFAQLGTPRTLPIHPRFAESLDYSFTFAEDGLMTSGSFANTARGLAVSSMLLTAAGGAATAGATVAGAPTARLEAATARIKAEADLIEARSRLRKLQEEAGQAP